MVLVCSIIDVLKDNNKPDPYAVCQEKVVGEKIHLLLLLVYFGDKIPLQHKLGCKTLERPHCLHQLEHKRGRDTKHII